MQNEPSDIDILIAKSLSGEATQTETDELNRRIEESPANKRLFEENKRIWQKSHSYFSSSEISSDREKIKDGILLQTSKLSKAVVLPSWLFKVAAVLALPVMLGIGWYLGSSRMSSETQMCEVTAPKGQISKCILADGTEVWLNAGTTISYDPSLMGKTREIQLDGEAYFKVSKNKYKPFIVNTAHSQIKVLGTVFNLKAYSGENNVETTLEEGEVQIKRADNKLLVQLNPGQQAQYNIQTNHTRVQSVSPKLYSLWKNNELRFVDISFEELVPQIERWYGVIITLDSTQKNNDRFTMAIKTESLRELLNMMKLTSKFNYEIKGEQVKINF